MENLMPLILRSKKQQTFQTAWSLLSNKIKIQRIKQLKILYMNTNSRSKSLLNNWEKKSMTNKFKCLRKWWLKKNQKESFKQSLVILMKEMLHWRMFSLTQVLKQCVDSEVISCQVVKSKELQLQELLLENQRFYSLMRPPQL